MSRHHPVFSSIYYIFSPIGLKCLSTVYPFTTITAWRHPYPFVDPLSVSECLYLCHKYASHLWRPWQGSVALFLLKHLQIIVIINVLDLSSESDTVLTLSLSQYETKIQCMTIKWCFTGELLQHSDRPWLIWLKRLSTKPDHSNYHWVHIIISCIFMA